ncbi:MAG: hypothetical protein ACE5OZ_04550 [Candidatus Heimdallarchaeota archaeon]
MAKESAPSETEVLKQLKNTISRFIERIGQEVQQLHQAVETIQREIQSSQAKTDMQIVELSSRLSNLENAMEGIDSRPDTSQIMDVLPKREPAPIPAHTTPTHVVTPVEPSSVPTPTEQTQAAPGDAISPSLSTSGTSSPTPKGEEKEEKRELLKALQLIDSL